MGGTYYLIENQGLYPALEFVARINNVANERYMEVFGFRALGINALAGVQVWY